MTTKEFPTMVLLTRPLHMTTLIYPHRCKNLQSLVTSATTPQSSFDFDDLFGLGLSAAPVPTPSPPLLKLNPRAALDPGAFQQKWHQLPILLTQECSVNLQGIAALTVPQSLIKHMQSHSIHCIASGGQSPNFKFFFFAQKESEPSSNYVTECIVNSSSAKGTDKSESGRAEYVPDIRNPI